jgi:predicted methyltransferase
MLHPITPLFLAFLIAATACAPRTQSLEDPAAERSTGAGEIETRLRQVVAGEHRSADHRARDQYRNPVETLLFFGIRPDMTVVEVWPGGGWYTEILAPFLAADGRLIAAHFDPEHERDYFRNTRRSYEEKLGSRPKVYGNVQLTVFQPPAQTDIAPPDSVDMVVTFRNIHSLVGANVADEAFAAFFRVLKPGGVLGIVQHRLGEDQGVPEQSVGYLHEREVIRIAEAAGFRLDARSEINANPRDTRDHPRGVWTLPPSLRMGDEDREKYLAIGESDRMTLRFVKPE